VSKILVVDDSRNMRMIVKRTLRQAGFGDHEITEADNGQDALEQISGSIPDLILSDWNMPVMDGFELLQALRERGSEVKFGFVTSEGTPEMRSKANQAGALFLIAKPFTAFTFEQTLTGML